MAGPFPPDARRGVPVLAPFGSDADAVRSVLAEDGVDAEICAGADELYARIDEGALLLVITEEGLAGCSHAALGARLRTQPIWSDIPVIALTGSRNAPSAGSRLAALAGLGNVTTIHRPLSREALRMAFAAALRARALQYQVRDQLAALAGHAAELERRVDQRSAALAREIEERKRAESALVEARRMESLGRLTGGVAHDFNNLLQVVSGAVELLRMLTRADLAEPDARIERALASIVRATGKGAKLTGQLLAYGRRQPLASTAIDLQSQLGEIGDLLRHSLGEGIALDLRAAPGLWPVRADPTQLEVALLNLVINARDAMPGGGTVTLELDNRTLPDPRHSDASLAPGDYVRLALADEGSGMSAETAASAFEPFFTTKPPGQGTGLGLSQVQGFARQSGGHAWLGRRPGGLTVGILLPRAAAPLPEAAPPRAALPQGLPPGLRVLCVEDDPLVREQAVALLEAIGCEVVQAASGDAALALDSAGIDLVLSDVMMPGSLDGIGLAAALRARHPRLPIVLASGYVLAPERLQGLDLEFVQKPYTLREIRDALGRAWEWHFQSLALPHVKLHNYIEEAGR
ncbi:response regulator [Massilia sp. GCM10023247]|uniref:response regulator n=1 Tax=Massilia sp. GCM10023247 TaxID=3252643 RepID=UPI0036232101